MQLLVRMILLAFVLLTVNSCKKETPAPFVEHHEHRDLLGVKSLTGVLGDEPVTLVLNEPYSDVVIEPAGNNPNGNVKLRLKTGSRWTDIDAQGIAVTTGSIEIKKEVFRIYVTPFMASDNGLYNMLLHGNRNFAASPNAANGVQLAVRDSNGVLWTTNGNQAGSSFDISSRGANMQTYATVSGTVNCKMYDGNGNVKQFTQGSFTADFGL